MKLFSPALSKNGVGRTEPPKTPHPGDPNQWISCASDIYEEVWADIIGEIANAVTGSGTALDGTKRNQLFQAIKDIADAQIALTAPLNGRIIGFGEIDTSTGAMLFASPGITGSSLVPVGEAQVNIPTEVDTNYAVVLGNNGIDTFGCLIGGSKTTTTFGVKSSGVDPIAFAMIRL